MSQSFGGRLRHRRERQHISLSAIAEQTKIKLSLLEALERDDISRWPVGIFRRAYIRSYACAIGLDPDVVVREFLERYPDPTETLVEPEPIGGIAAEARPPTRLRYLMGSAIRSLSGRREAANDSPQAIRTRSVPPTPIVPSDPDLLATADLCGALSRADRETRMQPLLREAMRILDAVGMIVWLWDRSAGALRPGWSAGYPDEVLAQLPPVGRDARNATASAFRSARICVVDGEDGASGALVAPLINAAGCSGVLAVELQDGREHIPSVRALVTILAAQLSRWVESGNDCPEVRTNGAPGV